MSYSTCRHLQIFSMIFLLLCCCLTVKTYAEDVSDSAAAENSQESEEQKQNLNKAILNAVVEQLAKDEAARNGTLVSPENNIADEQEPLADSTDAEVNEDTGEITENSVPGETIVDNTESNADKVTENSEAKEAAENTEPDKVVESSETEGVTENTSSEDIAENSETEETDDATELTVAKQQEEKPARPQPTRRKSPDRLTEEEQLTINFVLNQSPASTRQKGRNQYSGWIYLGRFYNNKWLANTLEVTKTLPGVGRNYQVIQTLNMRLQPPARGVQPQLVKNLKAGDRVRILKIRRSGSKGHYWAEVELDQ